MDNMENTSAFDIDPSVTHPPLPYDDTVPYSEQVDPILKEEATEVSLSTGALADRIGTNKVYLISDAALATRVGKVRRNHI